MDSKMIAFYVSVMESVRSLKSERGQGLVEYALIVVLISLTAMAAMGMLGGKVNKAFSMAAAAFK